MTATLDPALRGALLAEIEGAREDIIGLARDLVATPSINPPGDESVIASLLAERMGSLGLVGVRQVGPDPRTSLIWERRGAGAGPRLALAGHLDTKPVGDRSAWDTDPLEPVIRDAHLHGLGSSDMKAAIAAMVHATAAVVRLVPEPTGDLVLLFTADEEAGMRHGAAHLLESGEVRADAIVIGEPAGVTRDWESLHLVSRGMANLTVEVRGTQMHSSLADILPSRNASLDMARALARFGDDLKVADSRHPLCPQGVTVNVGATVAGGVTFGTCSGLASFGVDIRFPPGSGAPRSRRRWSGSSRGSGRRIRGFESRGRSHPRPVTSCRRPRWGPTTRWCMPRPTRPLPCWVRRPRSAASRALPRR